MIAVLPLDADQEAYYAEQERRIAQARAVVALQRQKQLVREAGRVVEWTYTLYNMVPHGHKDEDRFVRANIKAQARYARRMWAFTRMQKGAKS